MVNIPSVFSPALLRRCFMAFIGVTMLTLSACVRPLSSNTLSPAGITSIDSGTNTSTSNESSGYNQDDEIQPYEDVITRNAITQTGLFSMHQVNNHFYMEIPTVLLGKDMLWYVETGAVPTGLTSARRLSERMVRWERHGNKLLLEDWSNSLFKRAGTSADLKQATALGVSLVTLPNVVRAFAIHAEGKDKNKIISAVIEITNEFSSDFPEASPFAWLMAENYDVSSEVDTDRSYISEVKAFPNNVMIRNLLTFRANATSGQGGASIELRHQIILLPEAPMRPRYADPRVGYFNVGFEDYSYAGDSQVIFRELIERYRLEKTDAAANVSEVVKPIVFYLSPDVPEKWRDVIKRGVESWQPVFEAAGFKNAILAKDASTAGSSAGVDLSDVRYSVIHWEYSDAAFGEAASISDPRTGEILFSHIYLTGNILQTENYAYFAQLAALDPRARELPLPDELQGELLQAIVSHEVGHTLGLTHNFKASQAYTVAQLRDPEFVDKNSIVASIMSYAPYNYVAQPEDGVAVKDLIPRIGPYDYFAVQWGYKPISNTITPVEEIPVLDRWAAEQIKNPWLAYDGDSDFDSFNDINDPTVLEYNLSSDRIESTKLGLKNLERSLNYLLGATVKLGKDYEQLNEAYYELLNTRIDLLLGASKMIGGVIETRALGGRAEAEFVPVPIVKQREVLQYILAELEVPNAFVRPDVFYRLDSYDLMSPLRDRQGFLLQVLLSGNKYRTLADFELTNPAQSYPLVDYLADIQAGVWRELKNPQIISPLRRALQRQYLDMFEGQIVSLKAYASDAALNNIYVDWEVYDTDFRAAARMNLRKLLQQIDDALPKITDTTTQAHLQDCRDQIERMLKL